MFQKRTDTGAEKYRQDAGNAYLRKRLTISEQRLFKQELNPHSRASRVMQQNTITYGANKTTRDIIEDVFLIVDTNPSSELTKPFDETTIRED